MRFGFDSNKTSNESYFSCKVKFCVSLLDNSGRCWACMGNQTFVHGNMFICITGHKVSLDQSKANCMKHFLQTLMICCKEVTSFAILDSPQTWFDSHIL